MVLEDEDDSPLTMMEDEDGGEKRVFKTGGLERTRIFRRPFVTAGWIVICVSLVVGAAEIALLLLVLEV
jgi:hypothetical protein